MNKEKITPPDQKKEFPAKEKEGLGVLELEEALVTDTKRAIDLILNKKVKVEIKKNERSLRQITLYDKEGEEILFFTDIPDQVSFIMRAVGLGE